MGMGAVYARTAVSGLDSDVWFILNNGRYICENGFPTINPFTIHEGLPVVLSQPLTAIGEIDYMAFLDKYDFDALVIADYPFLDMELSNHTEYQLCCKNDAYRAYVKSRK